MTKSEDLFIEVTACAALTAIEPVLACATMNCVFWGFGLLQREHLRKRRFEVEYGGDEAQFYEHWPQGLDGTRHCYHQSCGMGDMHMRVSCSVGIWRLGCGGCMWTRSDGTLVGRAFRWFKVRILIYAALRRECKCHIFFFFCSSQISFRSR